MGINTLHLNTLYAVSDRGAVPHLPNLETGHQTIPPLGIDPVLTGLLRQKGYTVIRPLGSGHTRDAFEVEYRQGSLCQRRVAKIPKSDIDETSITTRINLSKGDPDEREVLALNKISHPNIISVYDAFKVGDRTITIEEHFDAVSLEDLITMTGPIHDSLRFKHLFSQVISAMEHLHTGRGAQGMEGIIEGILHRDIKPSNILVSKNDSFVKLSDLQNAAKRTDISCHLLPTRGGTEYTEPELLNSILKGRETCASLQSECYALGATMYFALTGKPPFKRSLQRIPGGQVITINGEPCEVGLMQDGVRVHTINPSDHDQQLAQQLKMVPRQYRHLLFRCMSTSNNYFSRSSGWGYDWSSYQMLKKDFEVATQKRGLIDWAFLGRNAAIFAGVAGIFTAAIVGGIQSDHASRNERSRQRIILENLADQSFTDADATFLASSTDSSSTDYKAVLGNLRPYINDVRVRSKLLDEEYFDILSRSKENCIDRACERNRMSKRLVYSLMRSALMQEPGSLTGRYKASREYFSLVPNDFAYHLLREGWRNPREWEQVDVGVQYLRQCIASNKSIADIYALYFCDSFQEIMEARKKARNPDYFSSQGKPGYGEFLSPVQRDLISRAMALFYMTDHTGALHPERVALHPEQIGSINKPIAGLAAR